MKESKLLQSSQSLQTPIKKEIEAEVSQLSKRQYLRSAIAAAGALTMDAFYQDSAHSSTEYTTGLLWLHEKALSDEKEQISFFVETPTNKEWIKQKQGKSLCAEFDIREITKIIADRPTYLEIVHTHTLAAVQEPQKQYFKGRDISTREIDALAHQPPTFIEVLTSKYFNEMFKESGVDIVYKIVTPQGVWRYSIDPESEFMDHYYIFSRREDDFIQKVSQDDAVKMFLQHNPGIMHDMEFEDIRKQFLSPSSKFYAILPHYLKQEAHTLMAFKKEHIDSNHDFEDMMELEHDMTLRMTFACPGEKQRIVNEDITLKRRLGIDLSFTAIEHIQAEKEAKVAEEDK
ncbi:MAG: hypothetical protein RL094_212 [Candidatus Parcubacteria bacterium]|jgi:hypothetical protein